MPNRTSCTVRLDFTKRFCRVISAQKTDKEIYYELCAIRGDLWSSYSNFVSWRCNFGAKSVKNISIERIEFLNSFYTIHNDQLSPEKLFNNLSEQYHLAPWDSYKVFIKYKSRMINLGRV